MFVSIPDEAAQGNNFVVRDNNTGEIIPAILWANDATGQYEQYVLTSRGGLARDGNFQPVTTIKIGNISIEELTNVPT